MRQLAIAVVLAGFAVIAALLLMRRGGTKPGTEKIPPALRPGDPDDILESDRLINIQRWGFGLALFFAVFLPLYWFAEPGRMASQDAAFNKESVARGALYFALRTDPVTGEENPKGIECARCHGSDAGGGTNEFLDPSTGKLTKVKVPDLVTVFSRYENPPPGYKDAEAFIHETVERGRPPTDMPTWGNKYGGPLTDQQIDDIVHYLKSIQGQIKIAQGAGGDKIFSQFCSPCHGIGGVGGLGPSMTGGSENTEFPNIDDQIAFVKAGSKAGTPYGTRGKGTGRMPAWGGQLTDAQIKAVIEYERSL
ncbi:MAG: c-type cytochrome [Actinomycetota bacterium]|nr:c-type cytochrome [Actinomycetota bacterium]